MLAGDQPTAEDVVQEAFLGLYRGWYRVRDQATESRSALRGRAARRNALLLRVVRHELPVCSAEAAAIDGEDRHALMAAIARLTRPQREVLALKYYLGLGEQKIAALLRSAGAPCHQPRRAR